MYRRMATMLRTVGAPAAQARAASAPAAMVRPSRALWSSSASSLSSSSSSLRVGSSALRPWAPSGASSALPSARRRALGRAFRGAVSVRASSTATAAPPESETLSYEAEVDRMMDMIVNSLYSNREIFLRELVSNASDALDKARITALRAASAAPPSGESGEPVPAPDPAAAAAAAELPLEVRIRADPAAQTIVIEDTGIGMTRQELVDALGTIARSGTARFAAAMQAQQQQAQQQEEGKGGGASSVGEASSESNLIGRFGVGFYSAFLVADRVCVETRSLSDPCAWRWESAAGAHRYTVSRASDCDPPLPPRGTRVTLRLKPEAAEFCDGRRLSELIRRYSEFVPFPIKVWTEKTVREPVVDQAATEKLQAAADEALRAEWSGLSDEEKRRRAGVAGDEPPEHALPVDPAMTTREQTEAGFETANASAPLWTRSAREVTDAERAAFYASTFRDPLPPLASAQFRVEGAVEFSGLLFVPGMAPMEEQGVAARPRNVRLYARRVFISDDFEAALLPRWAGFVRAVVDSPDVPLNVSREILQESRATRAISKHLVKKTLDILEGMAKEEERALEGGAEEGDEEKEGGGAGEKAGGSATDYQTFWDAFGKYVKVGAIEDAANRDRLARLLRFPSSHRAVGRGGARAAEDAGAAHEDDPAALTGLEGYVRRAKRGQEAIYFLTAPTRAAALASPFVERLVRADVEVLLLTEPVDEIVVLNLQSYGGKPFVDLAREGLDFDDILDRIEAEKEPEEESEGAAEKGGDAETPADARASRLEALKKERAERAAETEKAMAPLLALAKSALGSRVERVAVSSRLASSPAVVVLSRFGWSENMERLARAQAMGEPKEAAYMRGRKILELNPDHPIVQNLEKRVARGDEAGAKAAVGLIYDAALLAGGYELDAPKDVAERIYAALAEAAEEEEEEEEEGKKE